MANLVLLFLLIFETTATLGTLQLCDPSGSNCFELFSSDRDSTYSDAKQSCLGKGGRGGSLAVPDTEVKTDLLRSLMTGTLGQMRNQTDDPDEDMVIKAWVGYSHEKLEFEWMNSVNVSLDYIKSEELQSTSFRWDNPLDEANQCFFLKVRMISRVMIKPDNCDTDRVMQTICQVQSVTCAPDELVIEDSGWCYYRHSYDLNFTSALQWCSDMNGTLFAPSSKALLGKVVINPTWEKGFVNDTWIGLQSIKKAGQPFAYRSTNSDTDITSLINMHGDENSSWPIPWGAGEPALNTSGCVTLTASLNSNGSFHWQYNTDDCLSRHDYICSKNYYSPRNRYLGYCDWKLNPGDDKTTDSYHDNTYYFGFYYANATTFTDVPSPRACFEYADVLRDIVVDYEVRSVTYDSSRLTCSLNGDSFGKLGEKLLYSELVRGGQYTSRDMTCYEFPLETLVRDVELTWQYYPSQRFTLSPDLVYNASSVDKCIDICKSTLYQDIEKVKCRGVIYSLAKGTCGLSFFSTIMNDLVNWPENLTSITVNAKPVYSPMDAIDVCDPLINELDGVTTVADILTDDVIYIGTDMEDARFCYQLLGKEETAEFATSRAAMWDKRTGSCALLNSTTFESIVAMDHRTFYNFTDDTDVVYLEHDCKNLSVGVGEIYKRKLSANHMSLVYDLTGTEPTYNLSECQQQCEQYSTLPRICQAWTYYPANLSCLLSTLKPEEATIDDYITGFPNRKEGVVVRSCAEENKVDINLRGYMYNGSEADRIYGYSNTAAECWSLCEAEYRFECVTAIRSDDGVCYLYSISFGDMSYFHKTSSANADIRSYYCNQACNPDQKYWGDFQMNEELYFSLKTRRDLDSDNLNDCFRICEDDEECEGIVYNLKISGGSNQDQGVSLTPWSDVSGECHTTELSLEELLSAHHTITDPKDHTITAFHKPCIVTTTAMEQTTSTSPVYTSTEVAQVDQQDQHPTVSLTETGDFDHKAFVCDVEDNITEMSYLDKTHELARGVRSMNILHEYSSISTIEECERKCEMHRVNCYKPCRAFEYNSKDSRCTLSYKRDISKLVVKDRFLSVGIVSSCDPDSSCGSTRQSHVWKSQISSYGYDLSVTSCASTGHNQGAYWLLVMPTKVTVYGVVILTAQNMKSFEIRVGTEGAVREGYGYGFIANPLCKRVSEDYVSIKKMDINCLTETHGNVVSVHLVGQHRYLAICDIEVF